MVLPRRKPSLIPSHRNLPGSVGRVVAIKRTRYNFYQLDTTGRVWIDELLLRKIEDSPELGSWNEIEKMLGKDIRGLVTA